MDVTRDDLDDLHRELGEIQMEIGRATTSLSAIMMHAASMTSRLHELKRTLAFNGPDKVRQETIFRLRDDAHKQPGKDSPAQIGREPAKPAFKKPANDKGLPAGLKNAIKESFTVLAAQHGGRIGNVPLAEAFGYHFSVIHAAMRELEREGFVRSIAKDRMYWAPVSPTVKSISIQSQPAQEEGHVETAVKRFRREQQEATEQALIEIGTAAEPVPSAPAPDPIREETVERLKAAIGGQAPYMVPQSRMSMRSIVRDALGALTMSRGAAWTLDNMEAILGARSVNQIPFDDLPAALERIKAEMEPKPAGETEQPTFDQVDTARQQAEGLARSVGLPEAAAEGIGVSAMIEALSPSPAPEPTHIEIEPSRDDDEALLAAMEAETTAERFAREQEEVFAQAPSISAIAEQAAGIIQTARKRGVDAPSKPIRDIPETRVVPRYEPETPARVVGAARSPELPKAQAEPPRVQVGLFPLPLDIDFAGRCLAFRGLDVFGPQGGSIFTRPAVAVLKRMADGGLYPLNRLISHGDWRGVERLRTHLHAIEPTLRAMGVELVEVGREDFRIRALENAVA